MLKKLAFHFLNDQKLLSKPQDTYRHFKGAEETFLSETVTL